MYYWFETNCSTNYAAKYADDAIVLVPEKCDIDITLEFRNVLKWADNNQQVDFKYGENKRTGRMPEIIYHL